MAKARKKLPFDVQVFLSTVDGGRSLSNYGKDQKVFSQGDPGDAVFYIQEGNVKVCVVSEQGKEAVVALHGNGDFFGESCLNGHPLRMATVVTMTECVIMRFEKEAIVRVLHDEPNFSEMFMSYLLSRNSRVEEDLVDQLFNSSEKRLARVLLLMANFRKEGKPEPVIAKISQETLAELQPFRLPGRAVRQLPDQSTTLWVDSSSTGDPRLRGAPPISDVVGFMRKIV